MFFDYLLLVAAFANVLQWAHKGWVTAEQAAIVLAAAALGIGALRVLGSNAFQTRSRFRKAVTASVGLVLPFTHGEPYTTAMLILIIFAGALIPFGMYVMISGAFATARRDPEAHERKIRSIAVGVVALAVILYVAAPYLQRILPSLN